MKPSQLWLPVPNYKRYLISNEGRVLSLQPNKKPRLIDIRKDRAGYLTARLSKEGKSHTCFIHRLVAEVFDLPRAGGRFVNHKNGNRKDNRPENLEWVSHASNVLHAHRSGLIPVRRRRRVVIDRCNNRQYPNISEAARSNGIPVSTCRQYLLGKLPNRTCLELAAA